MDERTIQFRVGVVVLATLIILAILVVVFGELPTIAQRTLTYYAYFPQAPGVTPDTPIRKSGILIGRVSRVELLADNSVRVTMRIDAQYTIFQNEYCRINASLLGDATLQIVRSPDPSLPDKPLPDGEFMVGAVSSDPLQVIGNLEDEINAAIVSIANTSDEVGVLASSISDLLESNGEQFSRVIGKAETALDGIGTAVDNANDVLGDDQLKEDLRRSLADLPKTMEKLDKAIDNINETVLSADRNLKNIEGVTKPLGERGDELVMKVERVIDNLDIALQDVSGFTQALSNPDGTVGQLLNNPDLYHNLNDAVANVECLTREMRPILDDVRIITDKVSRNPGVIIRDAVRPASGTKWITRGDMPHGR